MIIFIITEANPTVDTRPTVEVAAECDDGILHEVEADVALEAVGWIGFGIGYAVLQGSSVLGEIAADWCWLQILIHGYSFCLNRSAMEEDC